MEQPVNIEQPGDVEEAEEGEALAATAATVARGDA